MLFNSYIFIFVFLPLVLAGYYLCARLASMRAAKLWLIAASLFYYGWWNSAYLWLLGFLLLVNYGIGRRLMRAPSRGWLASGVLINLAVLGYYKYANFFVDNLNRFAGTGWILENIILPLGISFFVFQKIAFLVDAHRGKVKEASLLDFSLFVMFFPQLIAGPIVHHSEVMPQFGRPETFRFDWSRLAIGLSWFSFGLFKKVVIADGMAPDAGAVFSAASLGQVLSTADAWAGALAFAFQLYFDFSGYSDMAIGLGLMFGIRMPMNFDSPYQAGSIIDFWRRWHMTLSRFLRDYVYIPLGGNRGGGLRRFANVFLTMLAGGVWHGAGWTYVAWGALHGAALSVNHAWRLGVGEWRRPWYFRAAAGGLTFVFVVTAWVLFRADSIGSAWHQWSSMFWPVAHPEGMPLLVKTRIWIWLGLLLLLSLAMPNAPQLLGHPEARPRTDRRGVVPDWQPGWVWAFALGLLFALAILNLSSPSEFLYYQF